MINANSVSLKPRIAILGGGISGLSTAFWISEMLPRADITLIESQSRCGGVIGTLAMDGNLLEKGPLAFPAGAPATGEILRKTKVESKCISSAQAKSIGLWNGKRLMSFPRTPWTFLHSRLLSPYGLVRLLAEPFMPRVNHSEDETVLEFFRRRTGQEFLECFMEPFAVGVLSGDPATMSMSANLPAFHAMEKKSGSLAAGFWKKILSAWIKRAEIRFGISGMVTTPSGSEGVIEALVEKLRERKIRFLLSHKITSVIQEDAYQVAWESETGKGLEAFDGIVSCLPSYVLAPLCASWPIIICELMRDIPHAPLVLSHLAIKKLQPSHSFKGDGFLVQCQASEGILSGFFPSRISPKRCPEDFELLRVMLGGARHPEIKGLTEEVIQQVSTQAVQKILRPVGLIKSFPVIRHERGLPQLVIGHAKKVADLRNWFRENMPGFVIAGTSFQGAGIENAIVSGKTAAREITLIFQ